MTSASEELQVKLRKMAAARAQKKLVRTQAKEK